MAKKPRESAPSSSGPLSVREFGRFEKDRFDPLVQRVGRIEEDVTVLKQDVGVLKQDVTVLKQDVGVLKDDSLTLKSDVKALIIAVGFLQYDVKQTHERLEEFIKISEKRHYDVMSCLDKLMTSFVGIQDKLAVHDVRIHDLEGRMDRLEAR